MRITLPHLLVGACLLGGGAWLPAARAQAAEASQVPAHGQSPVVFAGGDGSSCESAVLIRGARGEFEGVASEYRWLSERHPGWNLTEQSLLKSGERRYDVLDFTTADGRPQRVCFDISEFYQE
ncbi:MAG: hypothetical protein HYY35_07950 [Deltaproteobacteria bacterium]|nr:hypothetical protein [Deltaproteobacteria bacterium]